LTERSLATMTDKKKIYISLFPLFIIILLIIGAGYFLLADEIKLPDFNKGPKIRRIEGFPTNVLVAQDQKADKQREVLENEQELDEFLNSVDKSGFLTMREKLDFNKEILVAVASEVESLDGHRIKIRKVYEDKANKALLVSIIEEFPGENCVADVNTHIGVDIVAINKTDWTIDFERVKEVAECPQTESTGSN